MASLFRVSGRVAASSLAFFFLFLVLLDLVTCQVDTRIVAMKADDFVRQFILSKTHAPRPHYHHPQQHQQQQHFPPHQFHSSSPTQQQYSFPQQQFGSHEFYSAASTAPLMTLPPQRPMMPLPSSPTLAYPRFGSPLASLAVNPSNLFPLGSVPQNKIVAAADEVHVPIPFGDMSHLPFHHKMAMVPTTSPKRYLELQNEGADLFKERLGWSDVSMQTPFDSDPNYWALSSTDWPGSYMPSGSDSGYESPLSPMSPFGGDAFGSEGFSFASPPYSFGPMVDFASEGSEWAMGTSPKSHMHKKKKKPKKPPTHEHKHKHKHHEHHEEDEECDEEEEEKHHKAHHPHKHHEKHVPHHQKHDKKHHHHDHHHHHEDHHYKPKYSHKLEEHKHKGSYSSASSYDEDHHLASDPHFEMFDTSRASLQNIRFNFPQAMSPPRSSRIQMSSQV